jgi:hypothetical protein
MKVRAALPISPLQDPARRQQAYRLEVEDGRLMKGRVLWKSSYAQRMRRWLPLLPAEHFARIIAAHGRAMLEEWVPGDSPGGDAAPALFFRAGQLLGVIHSIQPDDTSGVRTRLPQRVRHLWYGLRRLCRAGLLPERAADHLLQVARTDMPRRSTWRLAHGDYCGANLVLCDERLCCIDNVTVQPKYVAEDLARTWYRWPMSAAQWQTFMTGYAEVCPVDECMQHQRFWRVATIVSSAVHRLKRRVRGAPEIVQRLLNLMDSSEGLAA